MRKMNDFTGKRFGIVVAIRVAQRNPVRWECLCDCGNTFLVHSARLLRGILTNCGCLDLSHRLRTRSKDGRSKSTEYNTWSSMLKRCYNPDNRDFRHYGGRGIVICKRWRDSFDAFSSDMGKKPKGCVIDREKTNGHYSCGKCPQCIENGWPMNCRWVDVRTSVRNRRVSLMLTAFGETKCASEWVEDPRCMVSNVQTLKSRLQRVGWDHERAIVTPPLR